MTTNLPGFLYATFQQTATSKLINKHPVDTSSYSSKFLDPSLGTEKPPDCTLMDCDEDGEVDEHWSFSSILKLESKDGYGIEGLISFEIKLTVESGTDDQIAQMEVLIRKSKKQGVPEFRYHFKKCFLGVELLDSNEQTVVKKEIDMTEQKDCTPNFFSVWINCERAFLEEDLRKACQVVDKVQEDGSTTSLEIVSARVKAVLEFGYPKLLKFCMSNRESFQDIRPAETHEHQINSKVPNTNDDSDDLSNKSDSEDSCSFSDAETIFSSDSEAPLLYNHDNQEQQVLQPNNVEPI